jgi:predicted transport protein
MSDAKLFRIKDQSVEELKSSSMTVEKSLQDLIERHLETFLGVRFLNSEHSTGKTHGGRIDTLGIDESNCPVIIEYKRALNENVINQGLFYLNWLMDHRADFKLLVMDKMGTEIANQIEWRYPRLVCVAGDFTRYDVHAIEQFPRNIDLVRYRRYGDDLILLEQVATSSVANQTTDGSSPKKKATDSGHSKPESQPKVLRRLEQCSNEVRDWWSTLRAYTLGLGEGIEERVLEGYIAFRQVRNFAYIRFMPTLNRIVIHLPIDPNSVTLEEGFTRALGDNEVRVDLDSAEKVERVQALILRSYQQA